MKKNKKEKKDIKKIIIKVINIVCYIITGIFILSLLLGLFPSNKNDDYKLNNTNKNYLVLNSDIQNPNDSDMDSFLNYNDTNLLYVYDDNKKLGANPYGLGLFFQAAHLLQENYNVENLGIISAYRDSNGWLNEFNIVRLELYEPTIDNIYVRIYDENNLLYTLGASNNWGFTGNVTAQYFKFTNSDLFYPYAYNIYLQNSFSYMLYDNGDNFTPFYLTLAPYLEINNKIRNFDLRFKYSATIQNVSVDIPPIITNTSYNFNGLKYESGGDITLHLSNYEGNTTENSYVVYNYPITLSNGGYKYDLKSVVVGADINIRQTPQPFNLKNIVCTNLIYKELSKIGYILGNIQNRYYFNNLRYGDYLTSLVSVVEWSLGYEEFNGYINNILISTNFGTFNNMSINIKRNEFAGNSLILFNIRFGSVIILNAYFSIIQNGNTNDAFVMYDETSDVYVDTTYINKIDNFNDFYITYKVSETPTSNDNNLYLFLELFTNNTNNLYFPSIVGDGNINVHLGDTFSLIANAFSSLIPFLTIAIFPNITLGVLLLVPLAISVLIFVFKMFKR